VNKIQGAAIGPAAAGQVRGEHRGSITGEGFREILSELTDAGRLKFSKHAIERISRRGIKFDKASLEKLDAAIDTARNKGGTESLVLMDELALIVSVKNRTVVTAMSSGDVKGNVFTSIDSAVIA
jgi:flagellar operon protein